MKRLTEDIIWVAEGGGSDSSVDCGVGAGLLRGGEREGEEERYETVHCRWDHGFFSQDF